jgi:KaiC/GvpD/RAD55 family RecA-like ATPase
MPELPERTRLYKELIEFILSQQGDIINLDRLGMFLTKAGRRYPLLRDTTIGDDYFISLPEEAEDDEEETLKNLSAIIGCAYKVLEMFVGSATARERITASVDKFKELHPKIEEDPVLKRFLPRREEPGKEKEEPEAADILKAQPEGIPYYDEEKKEWILKPAHIVKKVKEKHAGIEPVFEEGALKRKKKYKKTKTKKVKKRKRDGEPYSWLQEEFRSNETFFVEGTGQEKNMLCAEFLKEGLENGEEVIAILGYPPKIFLSQMQKIGAMERDLENIHIIDWHTFKEAHVVDISTEENVTIVPKDPKFMGSVLTKMLGKLDRKKRKRAFVSVVSYALAFIDFETVYNFVQITKLKFKKANVAALFTIEAGQHDRDTRKAFAELTDGWIRIREGMSGANTWKMKAEILPLATGKTALKDVVIMRDGIVVLDKKGAAKDRVEEIEKEETEEEEEAPAVDPYLVEKIEMWKGMGFSVEPLEYLAEKGDKDLKKAVDAFEKRAGKALEARGRLDEIAAALKKARDKRFDDEVKELRAMIRDLEELDMVDARIASLEGKAKKRVEKEDRRRDREKEIFRIRLEHWSRQGYDTGRLEAIMDKDLETVNKEFAAFRSLVNRLKRMEEELNKMDTKGHEDVIKAVRKRLFDVNNIEKTEQLFKQLTEDVMVKEKIKETAKVRRNELMDEIFNWALEGYCVDLIDQIDIFREDLGTLESRLGRLRKAIERLKMMEDIVNSLDLSRHRDEEMQIRSMLKDVERVDEVERKVLGLQESIKGKIPGEVMAIDANIERVRELEETWQKLKLRLLAESKSEKEEKEKE